MSDYQLARDRAAEVAWPDQNHGMTNGTYWPEPVRVASPRLLNPATIDLSWQDGTAACAGMDPELWFPGGGTNAHHAKAVCATCPLIEPCRRHGLEHERHGIWGGLSEKDRQKVRRQMRPVREVPIVRRTRPSKQRTPMPHGTSRGYQRHLRNPELYGAACAECLAAAQRDKRVR